MHVLVTCMNEEDPVKNEFASLSGHNISPIISLFSFDLFIYAIFIEEYTISYNSQSTSWSSVRKQTIILIQYIQLNILPTYIKL